MTKYELAAAIEAHHLYEPQAEDVYSKHCYRYSRADEIALLMRLKKCELEEMYNMLYDDGREYSAHEIN